MAPPSTVFETISTAPWWRSAWRISWLICSGVSIIRPCICFLLRRTEILLTAHHVTEELPLLAVEALQLHRFERRVIVRAGVYQDARQQRLEAQVLHVGSLAHDVLAREVVAALLQHLRERRANGVAVDVEVVGAIGVRQVLRHEFPPLLHS